MMVRTSTAVVTGALVSAAAVVVAWLGVLALTGEPVTRAVSSQADSTYLIECSFGTPVRRPVSVTVACADSNEVLDELAWRDWGADTATATGVMVENSCRPSCADGSLVRFPVDVTATNRTVAGAMQVYQTLLVTFPADRPDGVPRRLRFPLGVPDSAPPQAPVGN